jgi:cephamycin C biosynthesis protein
MDDDFHKDFLDLNKFGGLGEDPAYHAPVVADELRAWPLDRWADAPRDIAYDDLRRCHWKGVRLLKYPPTQAAYHDLLWELRPRTIIELGVYAGGSLVWFRDLTKLMGLDCQVIGVDKNLSLCQIPPDEMSNISLHEGDCTAPETLAPLSAATHPLIVIDDAHYNTFNIMKWAVDSLLEQGDYFIIEDMIPTWRRYTPNLLPKYLAAFRKVLTLDTLYANTCAQLDGGVFRRL